MSDFGKWFEAAEHAAARKAAAKRGVPGYLLILIGVAALAGLKKALKGMN